MARPAILCTLAFSFCVAAWAQNPNEAGDGAEGLNATLWMQKAHEYAYVAEQVYRIATARLPAARLRGNALIPGERTARRPRHRQPAIIVDLDETVLDNSAFQAAEVMRDRYFKQPNWEAWLALEAAGLVPGAKAFLLEAKRQGFRVFYVTDRECDKAGAPAVYPHPDCPARVHTLANLRKLGLPFTEDPKSLLLRFDQLDWQNGKSNRRKFIGAQYRVAMLVGDNLGDFLPTSDEQALHDSVAASQRVTEPEIIESALYQQHRDHFGVDWFILPNPAYGSWEAALGRRPACSESVPPKQGDDCYQAALDRKRAQLVPFPLPTANSGDATLDNLEPRIADRAQSESSPAR